MGWMTFVTPILVSSLGGARARLAQAGAQRTDVIWEVWEVFDHGSHIWAYLLGCYCAANGGVNDTPHAMGYVCVYALVGVCEMDFLIINTKPDESSSCLNMSATQRR